MIYYLIQMREKSNDLSGVDSLLDAFGVKDEVARRAFVTLCEERAHRLGAERAALVLGQLGHARQFVHPTQTRLYRR